MKILIAGFPYIRENYFATFKHYPLGDEIFFLLPKMWKIKGGKFTYYPPKEKNVLTTSAFFHHSHYSLIGGLLKGWMPLFPLFLFKRKYDLIYSCSEPILLTTLYQALWAKIFGIRQVVFSWENIPFEKKFNGIKGFLHGLILRANLFLIDGIVCGNQKGKAIYEKLTKKPVAVIPMNGVDPDFFKPNSTCSFKELIQHRDKTIFSFVGALGYRKGVHLIIEALADLIKERNMIHCVIVGSGENIEYESEIENRIHEYGLSAFVTRLSWVGHDTIVDLLACTNVFLYPSLPYQGWEEQFGYSIAEASLMEIPVISTRSGSINELIINEETGILIEPNNVSQLKTAMTRLADDPELRKRLGRNGRIHISDNFSHNIVAEKYYKFFHKIITV